MIYLPFIPVTIGALLEVMGVHGALMLGIVASMVVIAIGMIVMTWQMAGPLSALGAIAFATVVALGADAASKHEAAAQNAPSEQPSGSDLQVRG